MSRRDGSDEPEPTLRARANRSTALREELARAGIELDEAPVADPPRVVVPPVETPVDRGEVRRILIAGGVAESDLRWMTRSCPSEAAALERFPPLPTSRDGSK